MFSFVLVVSVDPLGLSDKPFRHAPEAGDHHQPNTCRKPSAEAAAALVVPGADAQTSNADDRGDHVAAPVHDVENGALHRGGLLTLNGLAERRCGSEVLRSRREGCKQIAGKNQTQSHLDGDLQPIDLVGAMKHVL